MNADFPDDQFKSILLNLFAWISIEIALKFPINNSTALVQMMAWHQPGDKLVSEPMMAYVTDPGPQWVKMTGTISQDILKANFMISTWHKLMSSMAMVKKYVHDLLLYIYHILLG